MSLRGKPAIQFSNPESSTRSSALGRGSAELGRGERGRTALPQGERQLFCPSGSKPPSCPRSLSEAHAEQDRTPQGRPRKRGARQGGARVPRRCSPPHRLLPAPPGKALPPGAGGRAGLTVLEAGSLVHALQQRQDLPGRLLQRLHHLPDLLRTQGAVRPHRAGPGRAPRSPAAAAHPPRGCPGRR